MFIGVNYDSMGFFKREFLFDIFINIHCNHGVEREEMKIQTGRASLKINHITGKKHWEVWDDSSKDSYGMKTDKCLESSPKSFKEGTEIIIMEPAS